jgi:hypothetical protein
MRSDIVGVYRAEVPLPHIQYRQPGARDLWRGPARSGWTSPDYNARVWHSARPGSRAPRFAAWPAAGRAWNRGDGKQTTRVVEG